MVDAFHWLYIHSNANKKKKFSFISALAREFYFISSEIARQKKKYKNFMVSNCVLQFYNVQYSCIGGSRFGVMS